MLIVRGSGFFQTSCLQEWFCGWSLSYVFHLVFCMWRSCVHHECAIIASRSSLIEVSLYAGGCVESIAWVWGFELRCFMFKACYVSESGDAFFIDSCELLGKAMVGLDELSNWKSICLYNRCLICEYFCCCGIIDSVYSGIFWMITCLVSSDLRFLKLLMRESKLFLYIDQVFSPTFFFTPFSAGFWKKRQFEKLN